MSRMMSRKTSHMMNEMMGHMVASRFEIYFHLQGLFHL